MSIPLLIVALIGVFILAGLAAAMIAWASFTLIVVYLPAAMLRLVLRLMTPGGRHGPED